MALLTAAQTSVIFVEPTRQHVAALQSAPDQQSADALELLALVASVAKVTRFVVTQGLERDICDWIAQPVLSGDQHILGAVETGPIWSSSGLAAGLAAGNKPNIIICGFWLETSVSFLALSAVAAGFDVFVAFDAAPSRAQHAREPASARLYQSGVVPTTTSQLISEWADQAQSLDLRTSLLRLLPAATY